MTDRIERAREKARLRRRLYCQKGCTEYCTCDYQADKIIEAYAAALKEQP